MGKLRASASEKALKILLACVLVVGCGVSLAGCGQSSGSSSSKSSVASTYKPNDSLASAPSAHLTIVGNSSTFKALENTITSFQTVYPNCTIDYEYLQDYWNTLTTRLKNNDNVDLFITSNIQTDSAYYPYAMELSGQSGKLDLSNTYDGFSKNFSVTTGGASQLYAVPLGGEVRGMYVNKTILDSLGLKVPTNYSELMDCCKTLKAAGYVPLQGNPGGFGQRLMYPYICNLVANASDYQAVYDEVESCQPGTSELFREPMSRLYTMVADGYYNYKYIEETDKTFSDSTDAVTARSYLNITSDGNGGYVKADDKGKVAFMPQTMSFGNTLDKMKDDYHSGIDYEFILSPVGDDGGYAYLSPANGIAINKNGANADWSLEFMNFLFSKDVNKAFASTSGLIPNTSDAMETVTSTFDVPASRVSQLGQVSFSYIFYDVINASLIDVSKGNNPKYMQSDGTIYDLDHYMSGLESGFAKQRS